MQRNTIEPRNNWQAAVEKLGFGFHSSDLPYWDESVYYSFGITEINAIEKATNELWEMSLAAVQHVIDHQLYNQFAIPAFMVPLIEKSWEQDHPAIYGRFDLCVKNGQIKLLEFNADTPTSLYEAGIVQWFWLQDFNASKDQFNSIHEKLIAYWKFLNRFLHNNSLHFTCLKESLEDLTNTEYMRDCAIQAGLNTQLVFIDDIGWDEMNQQFVDLEETAIQNIFKLYPWEWLVNESFGENILKAKNEPYWIEPAWKMILSNKSILPILWQLYPNHPLLLPAFFEPGSLTNFVKKPKLSREGANIEMMQSGIATNKTGGEYGEEGFIYQALFSLPEFDGKYPVIGSWIIGQEAAGMGIREADGLITDNKSRFVPHLIS
jgi:glutathionylspermidine synthase